MSTPEFDAALLAQAERLCRQAGRGAPQSIKRLAGGRNNQVYRIDADGGPLLLKRYFSDAGDGRDRIGAEWDFVSHARSRGLRAVAEPLACDRAGQVALYGFIEGRKLAPSELTAAHVDAAIVFVVAINAPPRPALAPASEACFSLAVHLATVERRVGRLASLDDDVPHVAEARLFVATHLAPAWAAARARIEAEAAREGVAMDEALAPDRQCLSPSDFGFHNALIAPAGEVTFLDFEYAGRDDPAKLVCDFFCQPDVPIPPSLHRHFIDRLASGLGLDASSISRCRILLDAYRIKWICIMLNDFLPTGAARRAFADAGEWRQRCARQLAKAQATLALLQGE